MANSLLQLLKDALRGRKVLPELPAAEEPVSHCGCPLPEHCWGSGGWHHYTATEFTMDRMERIKFAEERPGWSKEELRRAWGQWWRDLDLAGQLDSEGIPALWKPYLGRAIAYEPCPAYRAAVARNLEEETVKKAPRRKGYEPPANSRWRRDE